MRRGEREIESESLCACMRVCVKERKARGMSVVQVCVCTKCSLSLLPSFLLQLATLTNKLVVISSSQLPSIMTLLAMVSLNNSLQSTSSSGEPIDRMIIVIHEDRTVCGSMNLMHNTLILALKMLFKSIIQRFALTVTMILYTSCYAFSTRNMRLFC